MNAAQIFKNAATNYGRMVVSLVTTLLMTPFLLHHLGLEAYGLWGLSQAISGYFGLLDIGITSASVRYISHYRALNDSDMLNKVVSSSFFCYAIMSGICVVAGCLTAVIGPVLFVKSTLHLQLQYLMVIVLLVSAVGFLSVLPIQCVIAAQRQDRLNSWMLAFQILAAVATFICVEHGHGVIVLALVQLANAVINALLGFTLAKQLYPSLRFRPCWDRELGRKILSFAGWAFVVSSASRVIYFSDTLVVGGIISVAAVATYMVVLKIIELMRSLVATGVSVVGTFVSEQAALGNDHSLRLIWIKGSKWSMLITLPITVACLAIPGEILSSWVGSDSQPAALALMWLAASTLPDLVQQSAYQILMNSGRHKAAATSMGIEAVCNLALSMVLTRLLGLPGVAIGTFVPCFLRAAVFYPMYMKKITGLSFFEYFRTGIAPAILAAAPCCVLIIFYKLAGWHSGRFSLIALIVSCGIILPASTVLLGMTASERDSVRFSLRRTVVYQRLRALLGSVAG